MARANNLDLDTIIYIAKRIKENPDTIYNSTLNEIFDKVVTYEGLIHYGDWIIETVEEIYGVDLREISSEAFDSERG